MSTQVLIHLYQIAIQGTERSKYVLKNNKL